MSLPQIPAHLAKVFNLYVEELRSVRLAADGYLAANLSPEQKSEFVNLVHRLKGSSGFFAFADLAEVCRNTETILLTEHSEEKKLAAVSKLGEGILAFLSGLDSK
ncbi:MAG: Hpt domain-containing protein [Deltaproteobacteria bacterium]|nr:Hpt domain-containing protein [Deltaproteobacteria bacterium]